MAKRKRREIEARYGAPVGEIVAAMIDQGMTAAEARKTLGVSKGTLAAWTKRAGLQWPVPESQMRGCHEYRERHCIWAEINGRWHTLAEAAAEYGVNAHTVYSRYRRGVRGAALVEQPPEREPDVFELGLTVRDWEHVVSYAERAGIESARNKFDLPKAAIRAAVEGDWHRLS